VRKKRGWAREWQARPSTSRHSHHDSIVAHWALCRPSLRLHTKSTLNRKASGGTADFAVVHMLISNVGYLPIVSVVGS
jgi:hypothetical protein